MGESEFALKPLTHALPLTEAIDAVDRRIVLATQAGLPLTRRPYHLIAADLGLEPEDVMRRLQRMLTSGVIRRIGVIPNHYALGYRANAMTVWDVPDNRAQQLGRRVGALDFVSHCYRRPRHLPQWPYNLFAMVHGRSREEVKSKVRQLAELLDRDSRGHAVLYSTQILKKTGLRIGGAPGVESKQCSG
jgi:DNA-binding Lrp family transcriptional regulator